MNLLMAMKSTGSKVEIILVNDVPRATWTKLFTYLIAAMIFKLRKFVYVQKIKIHFSRKDMIKAKVLNP